MSKTELNLDFLQIMASKICHDLISPIGAVNNGIEFMEEMGADAFEDAAGLIKMSAGLASAKLQAYRIAYGAGGADSHIKPADVKDAIGLIIDSERKIIQDWDPDPNMGVPDNHYERPAGYCKLLICLLLMAMESLPKGGTLSVQAENGTCTVTATGENAAFRKGILEALAQNVSASDLEPLQTHTALTGMIAAHYGFTITASTGENAISLAFAL